MSSSHAPVRPSAALYDALEAVDAFIRTRRRPGPKGDGTANPSTGAVKEPACQRRTKRKAASPSALPAAHGAVLR